MVACSHCDIEIEKHKPEDAFRCAFEEFKKLLEDFRGLSC